MAFVRKGLSVATLLLSGLLMTGVAAAQTQTPDKPVSGAQTANTDQSTSNTSTKTQVLVDPGKIYNASSPTEWVGKSVELKNVTVQDTNDTGNFWVGSDSDHRLLVVKPENNANLKAMNFHKGDIVTVTGVIHPASQYMQQQTTASSGSMEDARNSSGVFLLANDISITSSTH